MLEKKEGLVESLPSPSLDKINKKNVRGRVKALASSVLQSNEIKPTDLKSEKADLVAGKSKKTDGRKGWWSRKTPS